MATTNQPVMAPQSPSSQSPAIDQQASIEQLATPQTNYQRILQEIDTGNIREDVWIEAYAKGLGNYNKAVSIYISMRADQLYKENTTFFKRTGDSVVKKFDPKNRHGKLLIFASILVVSAITLFGAQPMLKNRAIARYTTWCDKARAIGLAGKSQTFLLQNFGQPDEIVTSTGSATYVYNPCSPLCFGKDRFKFKVTVDGQTAKVSGWEWNALYNTPSSPP